jgi:hypothetical protein
VKVEHQSAIPSEELTLNTREEFTFEISVYELFGLIFGSKEHEVEVGDI